MTNSATYGCDGFGAYFGDSTLDTITKAKRPLTFINPQVQNPPNNMLTDTLNWVPVTGTFVANGTEKFLVIGNFKSDAATNTVLINPTNLPTIFCDACVDDVSCIELNLPAYAGRDTTVLPGSSVFLGREPDFATDSGCIWYKLPNLATPIATVSGLFVNPTSTSTYVVKQILDCSPEKWDTVVVKVDATVGNYELRISSSELDLFPNPANDFIELKIKIEKSEISFNVLSIFDNLGQLVREEKVKSRIETKDLPEGVYLMQLAGDAGIIGKRFIISR